VFGTSASTVSICAMVISPTSGRGFSIIRQVLFVRSKF